MADKETKKRKRAGDGAKKTKKVAIAGPPAAASVSSVMRPRFCPPVIASATGLEIPSDTTFHSYIPKSEIRSKTQVPKLGGNKNFLLHATEHRTMDYTARDEAPRGSNPLLSHFVAVFDPRTGGLQVVEAKKMAIRGAVRAKQASSDEMAADDVKQTHLERRQDLGQAFGTRKARKALDDNIMNTISPQKNNSKGPPKLDKAEEATLASVGEITSTMASREELDAAVNAAKPVPIPNMEADDIADVYDPAALIGEDILALVPIREWQEKIKHGEGISTFSRFVANRVNHLASNDDEELQLRVLRYFSFVLQFYLLSKPGRERGSRSILQREALREALAPAPEAVVENIRRKFSDAGQIRKWHSDLIMTHMCAFACIVDNFEVVTDDLGNDLRLDPKVLGNYFKEIGAAVKSTVRKTEGRTATSHIAKLTLPLQLPKQRRIPRR